MTSAFICVYLRLKENSGSLEFMKEIGIEIAFWTGDFGFNHTGSVERTSTSHIEFIEPSGDVVVMPD